LAHVFAEKKGLRVGANTVTKVVGFRFST